MVRLPSTMATASEHPRCSAYTPGKEEEVRINEVDVDHVVSLYKSILQRSLPTQGLSRFSLDRIALNLSMPRIAKD